jgi:hypothetical protein
MRHVTIALSAVGLLVVLAATGCKSSHEEGVTSNYMSQWTDVAADTAATTDAAKAVLGDYGFQNLTASSTSVDGVATATKADGTKITANIKKKDAAISQVSVSVGTMGDPTLGAQIAAKIKAKAEGH